MYVIAGLGNPGKNYVHTRHNLGFMAIDYLERDLSIEVNKNKHHSYVGEGFVDGKKIMLVKPQTYMNNSGLAIGDIVNYYNVDMDKLIVIYDDIDILGGTIRIRKKGSAGSHNGMKSIVSRVGGDFPRVRIGIGRNEKMGDMVNYVVGNITEAERDDFHRGITRGVEGVKSIIRDGIEIAMSKYNVNGKDPIGV